MTELRLDTLAGEAVAELRRIVATEAKDAQFRDALVDTLLRLAPREGSTTIRIPPLVFIPVIVASGITADPRPALPACVAALSLYLGIDQLDDVMDGPVDDLPAQVLLGATFTSSVAQLALAETPVSPDRLREMFATLSRGLLDMASGQHWDVTSRGLPAASIEELEQSLTRRSGAFTAMLAKLGAQAVDAPAVVVDAYEAWGLAYGTADQIRSDWTEVVGDDPSEDLRNGTLTHPLACLIETTPEPAREGLADLFRKADSDPAARAELRGLLDQSGALVASAAAVERRIRSGLRHLDRAAPSEPARTVLRSLIERTRIPAPVFRTPEQPLLPA
jgi:hypothetical protein